MVAINTQQTIELPDGRLLGYAEYGDPDGYPIFFFHGVPGSRLSAIMAGIVGGAHDARVIAIDRPGYGQSTYQPGRRLLDWPGDVREVADALGLDHFAVFGYSGGGPYAAVCGVAMPERVSAVALVSGMGPVECVEVDGHLNWRQRTFRFLVRHMPLAIRLLVAWQARYLRRDPVGFMAGRRLGAPDADAALMARPEITAVMQRDLREAFRQGARATAHDLHLLGSPWGFSVHEIHAPVLLWHGDADRTVPSWLSEHLAMLIPDARLTIFPGEGHLLFLDRMDEILVALLEAAAPVTSARPWRWRRRHKAEGEPHEAQPSPLPATESDAGTAGAVA